MWMLNHSLLTNIGPALNGNWATATPAQILADINQMATSAWTATGTAVAPDVFLYDPTSLSILISTLISSAGNISILEFVLRNCLSTGVNGNKPRMSHTGKWLTGTNNTLNGITGMGPTATNADVLLYEERGLCSHSAGVDDEDANGVFRHPSDRHLLLPYRWRRICLS